MELKTNLSEKQRIEWVDVFKGLLIIFMVVGHTTSPFVKYIYLFHIPAFIFIAGYTAKPEKYTLSEYVFKRTKRILLPFILCNLIFIAFYRFLNKNGIYLLFHRGLSISYYDFFINLSTTDLGGGTWFLFVIFTICIFYQLIYALAHKLHVEHFISYISILIGLIGFYLSQTGRYLPYNLDLSMYGMFYYSLGELFRKHEILEKYLPTKEMLIYCCFVFYVFGYLYPELMMNWPTRNFVGFLENIASAFAGIYICYKVALFFTERNILKSFLAFFGRHSMIVLIWHFAAFRLIFAFFAAIDAVPVEYLRNLTPNGDWSSQWFEILMLTLIICGGIAYILDSINKTKNKRENNSVEINQYDIINDEIKNKYNYIFIGLIIIGLFIAFSWSISKNNAFLMDDYSNIVNGIFTTPSKLFTILPVSRYNDRPVSTIFVYLLYQIFDLNYQGYHIVFFVLHVLNCLLVYKISKNILLRFKFQQTYYASFIAASIFALNPKSTMAVQWISGTNDITCCFFSLCSVWCFFKNKNSEIYRLFYATFSFIFYALSLRCKEMSLLLPLFFLLIDIYDKFIKNNKHISPLTWLSLLWMSFYTFRLLTLPPIEGGPYKQSFNLISITTCLIHYVDIYFNVFNESMTFCSNNIIINFEAAIMLILCTYSIYIAIRHKNFLLCIFIFSITCLLAPVLTIPNMQHMLYLYLPSVFIGMFLSVFICMTISKIKNKEACIVFLIIILISSNFTHESLIFRQWWISMTQQDKKQLEQLFRLGEIAQNCTIYVRGAGAEYNIIYPYGPGNSLRMLYHRNDFQVVVVDKFPETLVKPYVLLDYNNGNFYKISERF